MMTPGNELEVTPAMIEAGAEAIMGRVGGADLGGYFSPLDLAGEVFRAMAGVWEKYERSQDLKGL